MKSNTKVIGAILVVIVMIVSSLAYFAKSKPEPVIAVDAKVTELPERSITEIKATIEKEDIKIEGNKVIGNIKVNENVSAKEAENLIQQYSADLTKKYADKDINIQVVSGNGQLAKSSTHENTKPSNGTPKYSVKIEKGLTIADSYVAVTLDGVDSKNYTIVVLNDVLKYVSDKNFFHGVVTNNNEEEILKNIKITVKK